VGWVLILLNDVYFRFIFSFCGDSNNSIPPKNGVYGFVFLIQLKRKVWWCLRTVLKWIDSQRLLWHSDLNQKPIQHTCTVYQLSSDKRHTSEHESDVGWCDWPVTQKSRQHWQHFLFKFPFPKQVHVEIKYLAAHLSFTIVRFWCLLITASVENLCLPLDTEQPCCSVRTDSEVEIYLRW